MPRQRDIPRGQRTLTLQGPRGSGAGRISEARGSGDVGVARVGSPGRAQTFAPRAFAVQSTGQWGLRQLAGAFSQLAGAAEQVMDSEFRQRAKTVERQQSLAGTEYGIGVELDQMQLPAGDSIGDEAFRRSAILAARAKVDVAIYDDVNELEKMHPGKPEEFKSALTERTKAFISDLPPDMRPDAAMSYARLGQQKYLQLDDQRREFQRDENRASIIEATELHQVAANRAARFGDYDNAQEELAKLGQLMTAAGPVELGGSGALSLVEIEKASQVANDATRESFLMGWVDRSGDPQAVIDGLKSGETGNPVVDDILAQTDPAKLDPFIGQMERDVKAQQNQARMEARQAASLAKQEARQAEQLAKADLKARKTEATSLVGDSIYALQRGKQPPELAQVAKIASEFPELAAKLENGYRQYEAGNNLAKYPTQQRIDMLNELAADPVASREDVEFLEALKSRHDSIVNNPDKYSAAVEAGIVPPTPLDLTDPASVQMREDAADEIEAVWPEYKGDITIMRKDEIEGLTSAMEEMTPEEQSATLGKLSGQTKPERFGRVLKEIAGKEPAIAMGADVAREKPQLGADILRGTRLRKDGTVQMPSADELATAGDEVLGQAYRHSGSRADAVRDAAASLYAARRFDGGQTGKPDFADSDEIAAYQDALGEVAGGLIEYNGQKIVAPDRKVDEDTFAQIVGMVDDEDLAVLDDAGKGVAPIMPGGGRLTAEAFKKYATLEPVGPGRYLVKVANGYAIDPLTNDAYVFDWQGMTAGAQRRAAEGLRSRREDIIGDQLGGDAGADRLAPGIGGTLSIPLNPSVGLLLQRLFSRVMTPAGGQPLPPAPQPPPPPDSKTPQSAGNPAYQESMAGIAENAQALAKVFGGEYPMTGRQSDMVVDMRPQTKAANAELRKTQNEIMRVAKKYDVPPAEVTASFNAQLAVDGQPETFAEMQKRLESFLAQAKAGGKSFWRTEE